ncbi:MAG: YbjQ family protein [Fidelibacterota bacterium]
MIITNTDSVPNREVTEILGVVRGNSVRAKHIGRDLMAGLKGIVGGEISGYTELLADSREEAYKRMTEKAESLGADAILNVRFVTSMIAQTMSEMLAYGTAVKLK